MSALVDLVSVLIWPGVTVWFIKKYGDDVKALILRLSRIKMGGAEAEFAANLGVAEALAVDTPAINIQDAVNNEDTEFFPQIIYSATDCRCFSSCCNYGIMALG